VKLEALAATKSTTVASGRLTSLAATTANKGGRMIRAGPHYVVLHQGVKFDGLHEILAARVWRLVGLPCLLFGP